MIRLLSAFLCVLYLAVPASALEITAPQVPDSGARWMPEETGAFGQGLWELVCRGFGAISPGIREAAGVSCALVCVVVLVSLVQGCTSRGDLTVKVCSTGAISLLLLENADAMIALGTETILEISEYGKLLLPVMTTALAAQGGVTASAALYAGTAVFDAALTGLIRSVLVPGIWLYLAVCIASSATGQELLKRMGELIKTTISWTLKTGLMVFTTYLGITGVVSGTTDAAALKATKVTISSFVPVVGGILSDASEAVLVGAGLMKNAAGIYGILAVLAVCLEPFLRIGVQYLVLKLMAAVCEVLGGKPITELIGCFSTAMGLLLGMTGCCCVMVLVSTVCFLRGVGG